MPVCSQCVGGVVTYDEDGRTVQDACYHCSETGVVSDEVARLDALHVVVVVLAWMQARDFRRRVDSDPDGDGFAFAAAENGQTAYDYLTEKAWSYEPEISDQLLALPVEMQDVLIAWAAAS